MIPNNLLEMSQEDVRDWLYSDLNDLIDTDYSDHPTEKGGGEE